MKSKEALKNEVEKMITIWSTAKTYFNDNIYLFAPDTIQEQVVAKNDLFIRRARYSLGVLSVLQINKLFGGKNDAYSFSKFLNKLLTNHKDSNWKDLISIEQIYEWQNKLNDPSIIASIKKLNTLRNQYYAHSDRNPSSLESLVIDFSEMENLLKVCEDILLKISVDVFNQYYYELNSDTEKASGILKRLSICVAKKSTGL